jgi:hypothetical protein
MIWSRPRHQVADAVIDALAVTGILLDVRDQTGIEYALPIVGGIKAAVKIEVGASRSNPTCLATCFKACRPCGNSTMSVSLTGGRCSKGVDPVLEGYSKLIPIDEEANHQIVYRRRFGKANGAPCEPLDPGLQVEVFALDFLRVLLANVRLLWGDVPLVRAPPIGVKAGNTKRLQQRLQLQKDRILASPKNVGQHGLTVMIDRMPQPPRLRFLPSNSR